MGSRSGLFKRKGANADLRPVAIEALARLGVISKAGTAMNAISDIQKKIKSMNEETLTAKEWAHEGADDDAATLHLSSINITSLNTRGGNITMLGYQLVFIQEVAATEAQIVKWNSDHRASGWQMDAIPTGRGK